jgi:hypothetical protein
MAMTITPDGRTVWIPDAIAPMSFALPGELGKHGGDLGGGPIAPPPPPPPPPPTPPIGGTGPGGGTMGPRGRNMIGLGPFTGGGEIAAPSDEIASVTGGQLPIGMPEQPPMGPQTPREFVAATYDVPDAKGQAKHNKAYAKQEAQKAAFAASPEGQARQGAAEAQGVTQEQAATARTQGYVEGQELAAAGAIENEGLQRADKVRAQAEQEMAARKQGLADKQQALDAAVKTEADYKIDDNRRWSNLSTGRKILAGISVALSGLGDAFMNRTGPNLAFGIIKDALEQDVAAQVRERENLGKRIGIAKSSIDNYRQITGDMADAHKLKLSEEYDRIAQQVRASAAQYGSDKAKLRGEALALQFEQAGAAIRTSAAESAFNRDYQRSQLENARRQTNISAGNLALNQKQFDWSKEYQGKQLQLQAAALENETNKQAAAGKADVAAKVGKLGIPAPPVAVKNPETGEITMQPGGVLMNGDQPVLVGTEDEAKEIRNKMAVSQRIVANIDRIREIRARVGGESSLLNSNERQELETIMADVLLLKKSGTQGMSSDKDMENISKAAGTADAASWRDQEGRLAAARDLVAKNLNADLKYKAGYSGPPITFTDPIGQKPPETVEDRQFINSVKAPNVFDSANVAATEMNSPTADGVFAKDMDRAREFTTTGTTKPQRDLVQSFVTKALDPKTSPAQRDAAYARLAAGAQKGETEAIRAYYANALQQLVSQSAAPALPPEELE